MIKTTIIDWNRFRLNISLLLTWLIKHLNLHFLIYNKKEFSRLLTEKIIKTKIAIKIIFIQILRVIWSQSNLLINLDFFRSQKKIYYGTL